MDFQQVQYTIDVLVQRIRTGRLALPDFQRDFVWNPARVVELLDSVSRQWPIGSLLLLSGPQPFAIRSVESGPKITDESLDLYILDGQQRITSLFHAVANVSEYCYYIDFDALLADSDEYVRWQKRKDFELAFPSLEARANAHVALIQDVWDLSAFYNWLGSIDDELVKNRCVLLREQKLPGLHAKVYKVMAIVLDQAIELEALARIFETLNRTGVALNAFDLMVATLYPSGFRLRDEWDRARDKYPLIQRFEPDELEILKLIALLLRVRFGRKVSRGVRQGDLLNLDRNKIKDTWAEAVALYSRSLEYCQEHLGVSCADMVPSWSMVLGVAAWIQFRPATPMQVRTWWNDRLLTQYYAQAANTRVVADFDAISSGTAIESNLAEAVRRFSLDTSSKANGLLMRGLASALVRTGALDLITGEELSRSARLAFRTIHTDGAVKRVASRDQLSSLIVVSEASDKKLGSTWYVGNLGSNGSDALRSQGISIETFRRGQDFVEALLTADTLEDVL
jgi:Protein of unknown function DUF262